MEKLTPVTKSFLPPIDEYMKNVRKAYLNEWLTNRGELTKELEVKLKKHLNLTQSKLLCTSNGTIPIQIALKLLGKEGEIITTPFSYVATTAAIVWEKCEPVFVDIHPTKFTIDSSKIESAITEKTTCILATHVFGNPCDVDIIDEIAKRHNLKVIYDAAHSFGVEYNNKSIFEYGDVSTCSFHATKIFHTAEGGAIFTKDENIFKSIQYTHNFGHDGPLNYHGLGINAKLSELQAAMGLSVLPYMKQILHKRKNVIESYDCKLSFNNFQKIQIKGNTNWNYSYYPIVFDNEQDLIKKLFDLQNVNINPRRYFYPSLNNLPYVKYKPMPISERITSRIMCLPLHHEIDDEVIEIIAKIINS